MNMPFTLGKVKLQAHVMVHAFSLFETTGDPVIAKGPEVTQYRNATGMLEDHAERSQAPRLRLAVRIRAPSSS